MGATIAQEFTIKGRNGGGLDSPHKLARGAVETFFLVYGQPLSNITSFKYLGRLLFYNKYYWPKLVANLRKVWKTWMRV